MPFTAQVVCALLLPSVTSPVARVTSVPLESSARNEYVNGPVPPERIVRRLKGVPCPASVSVEPTVNDRSSDTGTTTDDVVDLPARSTTVQSRRNSAGAVKPTIRQLMTCASRVYELILECSRSVITETSPVAPPESNAAHVYVNASFSPPLTSLAPPARTVCNSTADERVKICRTWTSSVSSVMPR